MRVDTMADEVCKARHQLRLADRSAAGLSPVRLLLLGMQDGDFVRAKLSGVRRRSAAARRFPRTSCGGWTDWRR